MRPDMRAAAVICLALAVASLTLPLGPAFDPFAWLVWGREALGLELDTSAGPSWKPLPVMVTSLLGLSGDFAEHAWLVLSRATWLLAPVIAYRLAGRLAAAPRRAQGGLVRAAGPAAGAVAALGLVLVDDPGTPWLRQFAHGFSEPPAVLFALWAFDRHLDGRPVQALLLGAAAALVRPEAWPLVLSYAAFRLWRERSGRAVVALAATALVVPALWLVPDLLGSGDALTGGDRAQVAAGAGDPGEALARAGAVVETAFDLVLLPLWVAAAAAVALALAALGRAGRSGADRARDRTVLALATGAVVWIAVVVAETVVGYAGLARFLLPAAAAVCVAAGVGVGRLVALAGETRPTRLARPPTATWLSRAAYPGGARARRFVAAGAAALLVGAALPGAVGRASALEAHMAEAELRSVDQSALREAVRAAGNGRLADCGALWVGDGFIGPVLAWELEVPMGVPTPLSTAAARTARGPGVAVVRPGSELATVLRRTRGARSLSSAGDWALLALDCPRLGAGEG